MRVRYKSRAAVVRAKVRTVGQLAIRQVMDDVHSAASPHTPYRLGQLRSRVRKALVGPMHGRMVWDSHYAEFQERGFTTGPVRNYTTGGTGPHFAENAVKEQATVENLASKIRGAF